jgi:hypothetical protein
MLSVRPRTGTEEEPFSVFSWELTSPHACSRPSAVRALPHIEALIFFSFGLWRL